MFIKFSGDRKKARVLGLERPEQTVEFLSDTHVVLKVPGHSYSRGNRNSLAGRGYAPAAREVYELVEGVGPAPDGGSVEAKKLLDYEVRKEKV